MVLTLFVLSLLIEWTIGSQTIDIEDSLRVEIENQCIKDCPIQNPTEGSHYDYACNFNCIIYQYERGCKLWGQALTASCQKACNGATERLTSKEMHCVLGCNDAITKYFLFLKERIGVPPAPALVADSLDYSSLKLEWNFPTAKKLGLNCHVQWKYEELTASWQYCRNVTWDPQKTTVLIDNLQPYTKYRFRMALMLGQHGEPIMSSPSVVISTLPSGVPASPPTIVRAAAVDCTRISVTWEAGPFPHGPLLSYTLQITDNHPQFHSEVKDLSPDTNFYMFRNLKPSKNYTIKIAMRNGAGSGPEATVVLSTPPEPQMKDSQKPVWIIGTETSVLLQKSHMLNEPAILYTTSLTYIKGIAVHIRKKLLFVSESNGYVKRISIKDDRPHDIVNILQPSQMIFKPLDLSVDWLNDQLYILGEVKFQQYPKWQITRCNLDGSELTVAYAGLADKPHTMEIDPYNGYLFWMIQGNSKGLYRLNISEISNGIKHEVKPEHILSKENLGAFTVDHAKFRLYVADQTKKTIHKLSLDGKEMEDIRSKNVPSSKLEDVVSLACTNNTFFWTDGNTVFVEEYYKPSNQYFHNAFFESSVRKYIKIIFNLPSSQPIPVPVNPPTGLQAIFGATLVKVSWRAPYLLDGQGKGAWQNWSYDVTLKEKNLPVGKTYNNINSTSTTIKNLKPDTEYTLKVSAYTSYGSGPSSTEFKGMTLRLTKQPVILWSAAEGLLQTDAVGDNLKTLIQKHEIKGLYFSDVAWCEDEIYLVTNDSQIYWYNFTSHTYGKLLNNVPVGNIAIDWLGKKLYWSNPQQQLIIRGGLDGSQPETLPILTIAKELNIDSVTGYLYWATVRTVECARLNGADRRKYHELKLFSTKQVMGLTLDMDYKYVYWIVRGSDGSNLFRSPMAGYSTDNKLRVEKLSNPKKVSMQGPLCYFHNHFLWLQDNEKASISDLDGKNIASFGGKSMTDLSMAYVVDPSQHVIPVVNGSSKIVNVIPEMVDGKSISVSGTWNSFKITWDPVQNVNYGTVFYELQIDTAWPSNISVTTTEPSIVYWEEISPFTELHVSIRAYTYWGTALQAEAKLFSPPSTPSAPRNPRAYVTHETTTKDQFNITLRWDKPIQPNGILLGYKLKCWYYDDMNFRLDDCNNVLVYEEEYTHQKHMRNSIVYYYQVQAFTETGDGELSKPMHIDPDTGPPIPILLIASTNSIFVHDIDVDRNYSLIKDISTPIEICYLGEENKLFWINDKSELFMYHISSYNISKMIDIHGEPTSLTIDWLERCLYYTNKSNGGGTAIYKLNLNHFDKGILKSDKILETTSRITKIEISPFTKKLYWAETFDGDQYGLMQSDIDGSRIEPFFSEATRVRRGIQNNGECNCSLGMNTDKTFSIDHSDSQTKPLLIFIDRYTQNVLSADKHGCFCKIIANNTIMNNTWPLEKLESDFGSVYWTNPSEGLLYILKREESNIISKEVSVHDIMIFGTHTQPYPPPECLVPKQGKLIPSLENKTANSLLIKMPTVKADPQCENISAATKEYRVYYTEYNNMILGCDSNCIQKVSLDEYIEIGDLKPFTEYLVSLSVRNHFTNEDEVITGPPVVFRTAPGAPSKPQNVSVVVLNPNAVQVIWLPPLQLNGDVVYYEIHWQTDATRSGVRQKGEQPVVDNEFYNKSSDYLKALLTKLHPNETYTIWVRAYCETNESSSDSDRVEIQTYPEPESFILINRTAYNLKLSWPISPYIKAYTIQYAPITSTNWLFVKTSTRENEDENVEIAVNNLKPKMQYKFSLSLTYKNSLEIYNWPSDTRFVYETLGDRPSPPGIPIIQYAKPNIFKVWWEAAKENGAPIDVYLLESLQLPNYRTKRSTLQNRTAWSYTAPSIEETEREWKQVYNGTDTSWIISGLDEKYKYAFRVSALNAYGWSDPSLESSEIDFDETARIAESQTPNIVIGIAVPLSLGLIVTICLLYQIKSGKCSKRKKVQEVVILPRGPDVELATLRELPRRGVHSINMFYVAAQPTAAEISLLPHIRREKITLTKFLGSGAFGEVFEGKAIDIQGCAEIKVAVKTLRKGASDQEKCEFLQEAQLMSHFKHEHILQLLGVCLDNDPNFIIMELMEGGDLLTYLRASRSSINNRNELAKTHDKKNIQPLTIKDLLKMCVDVSRGCRYLEEMHFVHRDLACRNCLVSSNDPESRIVKIGDFGLARDIYKNDYYRKEGEGLLPVRWMAPESLVDGVFTSQSDVWAFGVLLWEILTLGQQPYPARNNLEVLHYVRGGGRLKRPANCPEPLYNLMLKCWEFDPNKRPTFKYCLDVLEQLHSQMFKTTLVGAHDGQYISSVPEQHGISNAVYFQNAENGSGVSWRSETDEESTKEKTPFLSSEMKLADRSSPQEPKYIEIVDDSNEKTTYWDGYEIPNEMLKSETEDSNSSSVITVNDTSSKTKSEVCATSFPESKISCKNKPKVQLNNKPICS